MRASACRSRGRDRLVLAPALVILAAALSSCAQPASPLLLYSPEPAAILLSDFSVSPEGQQLGLPTLSPTFSEDEADIVLDSFLPDAEEPEEWRALAVEGGGLRPGAELMGRVAGELRSVPYRMDLNLIVFRSDTEVLLPDGLLLDVGQLQEAAGAFVGGPGYSPRWQSEFVYYAAILAGAGFRSSEESYAAWNRQELEDTIEQLADWVASESEAAIADEARVFTSDPVSLLISGRIGFWFLPASEFMRLPTSVQAQLGYRLLSASGRVAVRESVLSLAIPTDRRNTREAERAVRLLLQPEVQGAIMERGFVTDSGEPGFLGALPTQAAVLSTGFAAYVPRLAGAIPPDELLLYPRRLPRDWDRARSSVVEPWLEAAIRGEPEDTLDAVIARYARQRGDIPR